jgi:hypothetical protein
MAGGIGGWLPSLGAAATGGGGTYFNLHGASRGSLTHNSHGLSTKGSSRRSSSIPRRSLIANATDQCGSFLLPRRPSPSCVRILCSLALVGSALTTMCAQFHAVQRATTAAIASDAQTAAGNIIIIHANRAAAPSLGTIRQGRPRLGRLQSELQQHELRSQLPTNISSSSNNVVEPRKVGVEDWPHPITQRHETNVTLSLRRRDDSNDVFVLPHVFDRHTDNRWEPPLDSLRDLNDVDAHFFHDTSSRGEPTTSNVTVVPYPRPVDPSLPSREFLGFIRITKTASSSIIRFLQGAQHLRASNNFLDYDEFWKSYRSSNAQQAGHPQAPACFFSRHNDDDDDESLVSSPSPKELGPWNCPHFSYSHLIMNWSKTLRFLNSQLVVPRSAAREDNAREDSARAVPHIQVQFRIFTIVRDPFDRMTSYFHFWRKIYPDWLPTTPSSLLTRLIGGDLPGWMEHRANATIPSLDAAHQYLYLSQDVNRAIRLISSTETGTSDDRDGTFQHGLRIVPLVSECFDASISLLVEMFPNVLEAGSERSFLNSKSKKSNERLAPHPDLGMVPVKEYNASRLYEKAQEWFADEFRFYDAAVLQFRTLLLTSSVDPEIVRQCIDVLDERENRRTRHHPLSSPVTTTAATSS